MKSAGKARNDGLYRHIRTSKEIIRNLLNDSLHTLHMIQMLPTKSSWDTAENILTITVQEKLENNY